MAKSPQMKLLSSPQTAAHIIRCLDASRATAGMHTYEHFRRSLGVWDAALRQVPMESWLEACRDLERGLQPLCEALALLMMEASANYEDVLGAVYMEMGQGDKRFGQFFTPSPVARCMAEIVLTGLELPAPGEPPLKIYEPACGSGVMFLAAAEVIESRYPGSIGRGQVEFYGGDLDPVCVAMCRLNLILHGIGRTAQTWDELTPAQRRTIERLLGQSLPAGPAEPSLSNRQRETALAPSPPEPLPGSTSPGSPSGPFVASNSKIMGPLLWASEQVMEPQPQRRHQARFRTGPVRQKAPIPVEQPIADEQGQIALLPADEALF